MNRLLKTNDQIPNPKTPAAPMNVKVPKPDYSKQIEANRNTLNQMKQAHDDEELAEHKGDHIDGIQDFILETPSEHLDRGHTKRIMKELLPYHHHEEINAHLAPYKTLKDFHDKHGNDITKDFIYGLAENPYHFYLGKDTLHDVEEIDDINHLHNNMYEEYFNPNDEEQEKLQELSDSYDVLHHNYGEAQDTDEDEDLRNVQYHRYKEHLGDIVWRNFREKHGLK